MRFHERGYSFIKKVSGLLLLAATAQAQQQDSLQLTHLREVSVTAPRSAREVMPGQQLQGATLQRLGSQSVADAIRFFSGVQVKDYGGIGGLKTVDVRGMGTSHTGVFYDGIQLGNAQNGQIDLGKFSLDNMESITLYNGQKSNVFQPARDFAAASAIYLSSLKPHFEEGVRTHLRGTLKTGSFGLFNPSLLWQQRISKKVSATLSTEWVNANGRYKFRYSKKNGYDTTAIRLNGDVNAVRVEAGLNGVINGGEWSGKAYFYNAEHGLPGFVVNGVFGHVDRQWDRDIFVQSSFRKDISKHYSLLLNAKYANDYTRYLAPDSTALYVDNHYRQQEVYCSAANQFTITSWWNVGLSADFQWNRLDADLVNFAYPRRYTTLVAAATAINLTKFSAMASLLGTVVNEDVQRKVGAPSQQQLTPAVFVSWQPFGPAWRLKAFYKRIFRMPTFNDLYYSEIGNAYLNPEFTTQYDLGLSWNKTFTGKILQQLNIETDAYYNHVTDKIVAMPTVSQFRWTMMNLGKVEIRGVDVKAAAAWQIANAVTLNTRLTYTYQHAQDFTDPKSSYYGDQILYIPWHSGSFILGALYGKWDANYSLIYTGERYNGKANIPENYVQPWYTSDIALGRQLQWRKTAIRLCAQVNNLFNQYYDVVLNYPMPGRNYKFIFTINI